MSQQKSAFNVVNDWVHTYLDIENSNFKKHIRQLESDLEDTKIQNEKKEMKICEIECENRVFKMEPTLFIEKDEPKMKKSLLKNLLWN